MNPDQKRKIFTITIVIEIIAIVVLGVVIKLRRDYLSGQEVEVEEKLPSIFTVLPYEGETFSVYYFADSKTFSIVLRKAPFNLALENAMFFLHQYDETRDYTQDDVRVTGPSVMYMGEE